MSGLTDEVLAKVRESLAKLDHSLDPHKTTASIIFSKPYEEVTDLERDVGKSVTFFVMYNILR